MKVLNKLMWIALAFLLLAFDVSIQTLFLVHKQLSHTGTAVIASLAFLVATGIVLLILKLFKNPITFKKIDWAHYALYVGVGFVITIAVKMLGSLIHTLFNGAQTSANQTAIDNLGMPFYLYFIFAVIFAPLLEEVIFRKCLFEKVFGFDTNWKWLGLVVSSLLFGFLHLSSSLSNLTDLGFWIIYAGMGACIGFATMQNKRIEYGWGIHVLNNLVAVLLMFLLQLAH